MRPHHHIYLIPGFFGFAQLGDLTYFHYVQQALEAEMLRLGVFAEVFPVDTHPTASIIRRGQRLLDGILEQNWQKVDAIHLIGHSTGGLDARLLVSPSVHLAPRERQQAVIERIRTVVSLSTPHYGTPIAGFFTTAYGKNLLQLLSLLTTRASGEINADMVSMGVRVLSKMEGTIGITDSLLGQLAEQLLADFTPERRTAVQGYMRQLRQDQGALLQLTPEGMDLFNATVQDNPAVQYLCYLNAAPPPRRVPSAGSAITPRSAFSYLLYRFMWDMVADYHPMYPYYGLPTSERTRYEQSLRLSIDERTSDGVVPTLSMKWGECVGALRADHLDLVGHFGRPRGGTQYADWLRSGAGFGEAAFIGLYRELAQRLVSSAGGTFAI